MNRTVLIEGLKKVMPGVGEKEALIEGASSFLFEDEWIKTFNDSISVSFPLNIGVSCLVKAKELFMILNKLDSEEVKLLVLDDGKFMLSGGKTTLKMPMANLDTFETAIVDNISLAEAEWDAIPEDFMKGLKMCSLFASTNPAMPDLGGVSIGKDGVISTDNYRASWFHGEYPDIDGLDEEIMLPIRAIKELIKINDLIEFSFGASWCHFRDKNGLCFSIRKLAVDFPREDIKEFLNFEGFDKNEEYRFPATIAKSVERASILSSLTDAGREYVEIGLDKKGNLIITGSRQYGEIKEKISPSSEWSFPKDVLLKINPGYFTDFVSVDRKFYSRENKFIMMRSGEFDVIVSLVKS